MKLKIAVSKNNMHNWVFNFTKVFIIDINLKTLVKNNIF